MPHDYKTAIFPRLRLCPPRMSKLFTMTAIDFKSLLRAERQKSRRARASRNEDNENGKSAEPVTVATTTTTTTTTTATTAKRSGSSLATGTVADPYLRQASAVGTAAVVTSKHNDKSMVCFLYNDKLFDLNKYLVCRDPPSVYYIPQYLSQEYQNFLQDWLLTCLPNNPIESCSSPNHSNGKWTQLKYAGRRVALFDARIEPFPEPLASLTQQLFAVFSSLFVVPPVNNNNDQGKRQSITTNDNDTTIAATNAINHVLINDYATSQVGILPHTDGPAYEPCTVTLSLMSSAILQFTNNSRKTRRTNGNQAKDERDQEETAQFQHQVLLEPGSLVLFCQEAYFDWLHCIPTVAAFKEVQTQGDDGTTTTTIDNSKRFLNKNHHQQAVMVEQDIMGRRISLTFRIAR